jgi:phosphotriesterase-related protein
MSSRDSQAGWTRREAIGALGMACGAALLPDVASADVAFPPGAVIRTILKDYKPEELAGGATLIHEHMSYPPDFMPRLRVFQQKTREATAPPPNMRSLGPSANNGPGRGGGGGAAESSAPTGFQDPDYMADELARAQKEGIACIVDCGHPDMGRNASFLKTISQKSGMPIVMGGGFYAQPFYPSEVLKMSEEQVVQALVKQVEDDPVGVFGEIGSWDYITADERKMFRAIGRAHALTNLPIVTHTANGKSALEQLDLLEDVGVKPNRIVIGHLGGLTPQASADYTLSVHREICRRGAFVGFDRQGGPNDSQQVPMVMALIEAGFANNLLFAADISAVNATEKAGGLGYGKAWTVFVPKLKEAGATEPVLRQIMFDNPRRLLAFVPKIKRKY